MKQSRRPTVYVFQLFGVSATTENKIQNSAGDKFIHLIKNQNKHPMPIGKTIPLSNVQKQKNVTVDFEKYAGVNYSPGKEFLITLVVVTFDYYRSC